MHYLYTMTMAEFNIRLFSFKRQSDKNEMLFREVSYYSMIGSHLNPKKLPKTKQEFWKIGSEDKKNKDRLSKMKIAMEKAVKEYKNRK